MQSKLIIYTSLQSAVNYPALLLGKQKRRKNALMENLNLMTRQELTDSQQYVSGAAFQELALLMKSKPEVSGIESSFDLFLITFSADIISDISYALESVTWDMAEVYARKLEAGQNTSKDDQQYEYWQTLQEKWGYLEMAVD